MKSISVCAMAVVLSAVLISCGSGSKEKKGELTDKKVQLEKLKKEQAEVSSKITALEEEIAKLDPSAALTKAKLVAIETVGTDSFRHYIDLQGRIDAQNVAMVSPQGQGGVVRQVLVRQGQRVSKGQLIVKLDDAVARQGVAAAQQQISGIKASVNQAQSVYERRQNLWKQNIGTEIEVINAKADLDRAISQLNAAEANVRLQQEAANMSNVYAGISGTVDVVNIKVGEYFSPQSAANPSTGIRIVNTGEMKVTVQVPDTYLGKIKEGTMLRVTLPESNNKVIMTKANVVSSLIDMSSRTFFVEGKIPQDKDIRPNQIANVQLLDYANNTAVTIPVNTLQTDETGKYVLVAVNENNQLRARRRTLTIGELYGDRLEVKSGLQPGDQVITEGFQNLYDGQLVTLKAIN